MRTISNILDLEMPENAEPTPFLKKVALTWDAATSFLVPIGYEDESRFHYGEERATHVNAA